VAVANPTRWCVTVRNCCLRLSISLVTACVEAVSSCPGGRVKGYDEARNRSKGDAPAVGSTGVRGICASGVSGTVVVAGDKRRR